MIAKSREFSRIRCFKWRIIFLAVFHHRVDILAGFFFIKSAHGLFYDFDKVALD